MRSGRTECLLVLAGSLGHGADKLLDMAREAIEKGWVRLPGYVDQDDLPGLYSAARAFCCLSLYEGFGLPPLEALACGTPVLASRIPVFEEVLGSAAHFVDPHDEVEIASGLEATDKSDPSRVQERIERASRYSWKRAATEMISVFHGYP